MTDEMTDEIQKKITQHLVDEYDDTGLTITEDMYQNLGGFYSLSDGHMAWLHFTDWNEYFDLPALEDNGLIFRSREKAPVFDDWRDRFPPTKYFLTTKAHKIMLAM